jgi:hypothetical protein
VLPVDWLAPWLEEWPQAYWLAAPQQVPVFLLQLLLECSFDDQF